MVPRKYGEQATDGYEQGTDMIDFLTRLSLEHDPELALHIV